MRLYVGGLPYGMTDQDLADLFEQVGQVSSASVVTDRDTGRSKGFGFVDMGDEEAQAAIDRLNGSLISGRTITVNQARERQSGGDRGGYRGGGRDRRSGGGGYRGGGRY